MRARAQPADMMQGLKGGAVGTYQGQKGVYVSAVNYVLNGVQFRPTSSSSTAGSAARRTGFANWCVRARAAAAAAHAP